MRGRKLGLLRKATIRKLDEEEWQEKEAHKREKEMVCREDAFVGPQTPDGLSRV